MLRVHVQYLKSRKKKNFLKSWKLLEFKQGKTTFGEPNKKGQQIISTPTNQENKDLTEQFTILKKCRGKFECLIYEMLFIQEKKPKLNTQSDSIKAKLFST